MDAVAVREQAAEGRWVCGRALVTGAGGVRDAGADWQWRCGRTGR